MKFHQTSKISPIVVPKASDILASQLREMIVDGFYQTGSFLPTERVLVTQSGLSRTSVRDALRSLESEGLITTRVGRSGGSMVTLPGRDAVARSVEMFVRAHGVRLESLLECRVAVEPTLAQLAAICRTPEALAKMEELHEQFVKSVDNVAQYKTVNLEWHLAVARAGANEPLMALMEAIAAPIRDAQEYQHVTTPELRSLAVRAHTVILDAIREQDPDAAFARMARHVGEYKDIATGKSSK